MVPKLPSPYTGGSFGVSVGIKSLTQQDFQPFSMAMFEASDALGFE
jgi:hypothetical protein